MTSALRPSTWLLATGELDAELHARHGVRLLRFVFPFLRWAEEDTFLSSDGRGWRPRPTMRTARIVRPPETERGKQG